MNKALMLKLSKWSLILIISVFSLVSLSSFKENYFEISKNLDIFSTLYKELNVYYVDNTSPGELMKTGIDAMLKSLDPYTNYIPESDIEDYRFMTTGQYGGIGSVIRKNGDNIVVAEPYEDSPSVKAGLKAGDIIKAIDGTDITGKSVSDISSFLKGQPSTKVVLTIQRPGEDEIMTKEVIREEIKVKDVPFYGEISEGLGYIKLNGFTQTASKEVKQALINLKETKNIKELVLDLRGNGGGLLREAVNIVNLFVDKGQLVVETRGRIKDWDQSYKTLNTPVDTKIPLVVLTDGGSASASEIVSGTLQDLDRAVIIGEKTYGKGLVQQTFDVSYNAKLKVTVAKYYIPSGRCIQKLDYSKKDNKGKAVQVADSLIQDFKTSKGRIVKDGAGILPDITVLKEDFAEITYALSSENIIFDYATAFVRNNNSIDSAKFFSLTDSQYKDFASYASEKDFDYQTSMEKRLELLKKEANEIKDENIQKQINDLEKSISSLKKEDIFTYQKQIKRLLENEIVKRYYFQKGKAEHRLSEDLDIVKSKQILANKEVYLNVFKSTYLPVTDSTLVKK